MMHVDFFVEDESGRCALETIVPKLLVGSTYRLYSYKGIGRLPKNLKPRADADKRILLDRLPKILQGYGKIQDKFDRCVVVVCDLDDKNKREFLAELNSVLDACNPKPEAWFCLAVEELEAWFLGDLAAIRKAYPGANNRILSKYVSDSICGTWEALADATLKGGSAALKKRGWIEVGKQKSEWANKISPHMNLDENASPSFQFFCGTMREIAGRERHNFLQ